MKQRAYGQYCGLARAVEVLGERWALLILRDLLVRPRRFSDLRDGLPGIPSNVLTSRLRELEAAGVVERRLLPAPSRAVVYDLTEDGRALDDAVLGLARWGATRLGDPRPGEVVTAESLVIALRTTFRPEAATGLTATWELHATDDIVLHAVVEDGRLEAGVGPAPRPPDLVITGTESGPPPLKPLMNGELTADEAVATSALRLSGTAGLLATFAETFRIG